MPTVYDGGVALTRGSNYSDVSDMLANAPAAGQYRCLTGGPTYVRLGSVPVYTVFANSNGGSFSSTQAAIEAGISDASGVVQFRQRICQRCRGNVAANAQRAGAARAVHVRF